MRLSRLASFASVPAVVAAALVAAAPAAVAAARRAPEYYVALGDSLSQGYQPGLGNTDQGYVDDLYAALKAKNPALRLEKLGCSGETTTTMINGGICTYSGEKGQLAAAEAFLRAHRGHVKYVTLDIGANDVDGCATATSIDLACITSGVATAAADLPRILLGLKAAGSGPAMVSMTYYDPFLAVWLTGSSGQTLARESVLLADGLNALISADSAVFGFRVAKVGDAFATNDFSDTATLPGVGSVPLNVARVCQWTYMCTVENIHANPTGYQVIANTFAAALPR